MSDVKAKKQRKIHTPPNTFTHPGMLLAYCCMTVMLILGMGGLFFISFSLPFPGQISVGKAVQLPSGFGLYPAPFVVGRSINGTIIVGNSANGDEVAAAQTILDSWVAAANLTTCVIDNCPEVRNQDQRDSDGDGVGDACDKCSGKNDRLFVNSTGSLIDSDGDGTSDCTDNCQTRPNADQRDSNGNGIGDVCEPAGCPDAVLLVPINITTTIPNSTNGTVNITNVRIVGSRWFDAAGVWTSVDVNGTLVPGMEVLHNLSGNDSSVSLDGLRFNNSCGALGVWVHDDITKNLTYSIFNGTWNTPANLSAGTQPSFAFNVNSTDGMLLYVKNPAPNQQFIAFRQWNGTTFGQEGVLFSAQPAVGPKVVFNTFSGAQAAFVSPFVMFSQLNGAVWNTVQVPGQRSLPETLFAGKSQNESVSIATNSQGQTLLAWTSSLAGEGYITTAVYRLGKIVQPAIRLFKGRSPSSTFNAGGTPILAYVNNNISSSALIGKTLAYATFDNSSENFSIDQGNASVVGSQLLLRENSLGTIPITLLKGIIESDVGVPVAGSAGIAFRVLSNSSFYRVLFFADVNTVSLVRVLDGIVTPLGESLGNISSGNNHARIELNSTSIRIFVNDVLRLDIRDSALATGRVGGVTLNANATFDNLTVVELPDFIPMSTTNGNDGRSSMSVLQTGSGLAVWNVNFSRAISSRILPESGIWQPAIPIGTNPAFGNPAIASLRVSKTCSCSLTDTPVCGDGKTFSNQCVAECAGAVVIQTGACCSTNSQCSFGLECVERTCTSCTGRANACSTIPGTLCGSILPVNGLCIECMTDATCGQVFSTKKICKDIFSSVRGPGKCVECLETNASSSTCAALNASKGFCQNNACVGCRANADCASGQSCVNNTCGITCDGAGRTMAGTNSFDSSTGWILRNSTVSFNGTGNVLNRGKVGVMLLNVSSTIASASVSFVDVNQNVFLVFAGNDTPSDVFAIGIRTFGTQKQLSVERWIPGLSFSSIPPTFSTQLLIPFVSPGKHTLKVRLNNTALAVLLDCTELMTLPASFVDANFRVAGIGIDNTTTPAVDIILDDFAIEKSCPNGANSFIPNGVTGAASAITGAVVTSDDDGDGIPSSCAGVSSAIVAARDFVNSGENLIFLGTNKSNVFIGQNFSKKIVFGEAQLEFRDMGPVWWLFVVGGRSEDVRLAALLLKNTSLPQSLKACIKTNESLAVAGDCDICEDTCAVGRVCKTDKILTQCQDDNGDGCIEQVDTPCQLGCVEGVCKLPPSTPTQNTSNTTVCNPATFCDAFGPCINGVREHLCHDALHCVADHVEQEQCPVCVPNWNCPSEFGSCVNGIRVRQCVDANNCGTNAGKPPETQSCSSCSDGIKNGNEQGIDCGGTCQAQCSTCFDGVKNQNEEGIDCGGTCATTCPSQESPYSQIIAKPLIYWLIGGFVSVIILLGGTLGVIHHMRAARALKARPLEDISTAYFKRLTEYVHLTSSMGYTRDAITTALIKEGWQHDVVDVAFGKAQGMTMRLHRQF